jgi:hypothetical protein
MALGLKTGPRAEKCYFTPANSVLKFNFTPARAKKHLFYSVEFGILGNTDLHNQLSGVYRLEIQKHNEKVKQNRYKIKKTY